MRSIFVFALVTLTLASVACSGVGAGDQASPVGPTATQAESPVNPAPPSTPAQTTPAAPPTPSPVPTDPPAPTPTVVPTPTPNPETEPVAWYIESIREKTYDGCCLERVRLYEQGNGYTAWVIAYQGDGLRLTGLMAVPDGPGPFPAAIINHGYFPFDGYDTGWDTLREVRFMAQNGYVAVAPDYRNYAGSDDGDYVFVPGYVYDVRNLLVALQQLPEVQSDRIGMMGHSMGGGITLQQIVSGAEVQVVALFGTVTADEAERYQARMTRWAENPDGDSRARAFAERYGTPEERPEVYAKMSPENYWSEVTVPVLIHHGDADDVTPLQWALDIEAGLRAAGKPVELHVYPGAGHSLNGADFDLAMARTLAFFDAVLRP